MHTLIPAMVYRGDDPVLSFGVMGGQYQAMGQAYVLSNWIDYGMDIQEALDAARFFLYDGVLYAKAVDIAWVLDVRLYEQFEEMAVVFDGIRGLPLGRRLHRALCGR